MSTELRSKALTFRKVILVTQGTIEKDSDMVISYPTERSPALDDRLGDRESLHARNVYPLVLTNSTST